MKHVTCGVAPNVRTRHIVGLMEIKCWGSICGVRRIDGVKNEIIKGGVGPN